MGVGGGKLTACAIELEDLLPQLAAVQVETVEAGGDLVRITARTRAGVPVVCPGCGQTTGSTPGMYGMSRTRRWADAPS
ncbi:hypothetical protein AB0H17_23710 [Streptomyces olivoreticuli]